MLWFLLFFLLLMSIPAFFIAQRNRDSLMDAMAMHEKLQRTAPEDPLAQLGPTEYQRAWERAEKNRSKGLVNSTFIGFLAGLFLVGPLVGFGVGFMLDDPDLLFPLWTIGLFSTFFYAIWRGASKRQNVYDQMRSDLHLN